jgi:hypothetical protein
MSSKHSNKQHHPYCLNCHYPLSEYDKNCSQCGQKPTDGKTTMHDLIHEFVHTLFHLDGKFFTTLKHLFVPAKLTTEFFIGHHKRYAHPVQLFLVIGALTFAMVLSLAKSLEEKTEMQSSKWHKQAIRNKFLVQLDSISQSLVPYSGEETKLMRDSLILKMKYPEGILKDNNEIEKALKKAFDVKYKKKSKDYGLTVDAGENEKEVVGLKIDVNNDEYFKFRDSLIEVVMDEDMELVKKLEKIRKDSIDKVPKTAADDFVDGFKEGMNQKTIDGMKELLRKRHRELTTRADLKEAIKIEEDSFNVFSMVQMTSSKRMLKIPDIEVYELTPDEIIKKYNITDFYEKIEVKQVLKTRKNAGNLLHFVLSKLFLMTFLLIPVLSLFFMLLYRRQKRYYVEHFVFLLHLNTTLFLVLAMFMGWYNIFGKESVFSIYFFGAALFIVLALKFYYNQGWIKTIIKSFIIYTFYMIFAIIFFTLISIIGFFIF